jgi:hypothetical protein
LRFAIHVQAECGDIRVSPRSSGNRVIDTPERRLRASKSLYLVWLAPHNQRWQPLAKEENSEALLVGKVTGAQHIDSIKPNLRSLTLWFGLHFVTGERMVAAGCHGVCKY